MIHAALQNKFRVARSQDVLDPLDLDCQSAFKHTHILFLERVKMLRRFGRQIAEARMIRVEDDLEGKGTPGVSRKDPGEDSALEAGR